MRQPSPSGRTSEVPFGALRAPAGGRFEMLWVEGQINTHMETLQPCNQKQREIFTRMLTQAKDRAQAELNVDGDFNRKVEDECIRKLVEERGASEAIAKVRKLHKEIEEAEESLKHLGFECDDERVSIPWNAPKSVSQAVETAKRSAQKERQSSLKKFDLGILGVWAAENVDDARKIVEELL